MPTLTLKPYSTVNGNISKYPTSSAYHSIISDGSTASYLRIQHGDSYEAVSGYCTVKFNTTDVNKLSGVVITNINVKYCINRKGKEISNYKITINSRIACNVSLTCNTGVGTYEDKLNSSITYNDLLGNVKVELVTNDESGFDLYWMELVVTYKTPLAYCKMQSSSGVITLPLFQLSELSYSPLRMQTSKGILGFDLISMSDNSASQLRIQTKNGILSIRKL